ncbi:MAG: hypothetical protein ACR2PZ_01800 [Pseudomonadales bacterium]
MIETRLDSATKLLRHDCSGTVNVSQLLAAIDASGPQPNNTLWDFRQAELNVPLNVVASPTYPKVRDVINQRWEERRVAFVVSANMHEQMVEIFLKEGGLKFQKRIFFQRSEAEQWLTQQQPEVTSDGELLH